MPCTSGRYLVYVSETGLQEETTETLSLRSEAIKGNKEYLVLHDSLASLLRSFATSAQNDILCVLCEVSFLLPIMIFFVYCPDTTDILLWMKPKARPMI